jgi:hypothetical protein
MPIKIQLFRGVHCSNPKGCNINFDNTIFPQKFNPIKAYYLLRGNVVIDYEGENTVEISSPYNSNWSSYSNQWNYEKNVLLTVKPSTQFAIVSLIEGNTNNAIAFTSSVTQLDNANLTKTMNANSYLVVFGSSYSIDGVENTSGAPSRAITANGPREVQISTSSSCELIYVEPV